MTTKVGLQSLMAITAMSTRCEAETSLSPDRIVPAMVGFRCSFSSFFISYREVTSPIFKELIVVLKNIIIRGTHLRGFFILLCSQSVAL